MTDKHRLHCALLVSLALHALLLYAFPRTVDAPRGAAAIASPLNARLTQPESIAPRIQPLPERKRSQVTKPALSAPVRIPEAVSPDQYRVQLIAEASRHKRYPPLARENEWQGDVLVAVAIDAGGRASVALKAGSGYEVLDRQALEMFGQAARSVPVPRALRGRPFTLDVRAIYGLEE